MRTDFLAQSLQFYSYEARLSGVEEWPVFWGEFHRVFSILFFILWTLPAYGTRPAQSHQNASENRVDRSVSEPQVCYTSLCRHVDERGNQQVVGKAKEFYVPVHINAHAARFIGGSQGQFVLDENTVAEAVIFYRSHLHLFSGETRMRIEAVLANCKTDSTAEISKYTNIALPDCPKNLPITSVPMPQAIPPPQVAPIFTPQPGPTPPWVPTITPPPVPTPMPVPPMQPSVQPPIGTPATWRPDFDYSFVKEHVSPSGIDVKIRGLKQRVSGDAILADVTAVNNLDSSRVVQQRIPISFDESGNGYFRMEGLEKSTLYSLQISVLQNAPAQQAPVAVLKSDGSLLAMTGGTTRLETARSQAINRGLFLYDQYKRGEINGRYFAPNGEAWCSEAHCRITEEVLNRTPNRYYGSVGQHVDYYKRYHSYQSAASLANAYADRSQLSDQLAPGNYVSMNGGSHSSTVLAYDRHTDTLTLLHGNWGGRMAITKHSRSQWMRFGIGNITEEMLRI